MIESLLLIYPVTLWSQPHAQKFGLEFWLLKNPSSSTDPFRNGGVDYLNENLNSSIFVGIFCSMCFVLPIGFLSLCYGFVLPKLGESGCDRGLSC